MEYAFEGREYGEKKIWADSYPRLGDARRAAREWIGGAPRKTASLLVREPLPQGHETGATWREVGFLSWTT